MELRFDEQDSVLIIVPLERRLDALAAPDFRARAADRAQGRSVCVVDLANVEFIDSSGLAALISVLKRLAPGGVMRLAAPAPAIRSLLEMTRLTRVFPSYPDVAAALRG